MSGLVNTYYPALGNPIVSGGVTSITLGPAVGATTLFPSVTPGDLLLVIQMQDAGINSTNTEDYGDGPNPPGVFAASGSNNLSSGGLAGFYEYAVATNTVPASGGTLTLEGPGGNGLLHAYTNADATPTSGQKRYQIIRVPQLTSLTVSPSTPITATPWDGRKGGIVAIDVRDTLNFNGGSIDVSGTGFRGGAAEAFSNGGSGLVGAYVDVASSLSHAYKGEGIAGTPRKVLVGSTVVDGGAQGYPNGDMARGAPGNGGGGGTDGSPTDNNDNTGGGGGGNGGPGGKGGDSTAGLPYGGFGGASFPATPGRVVMGGGGGAGTRNPPQNQIEASGGTGGGIALIRAYGVSGTGFVRANGGNALDVTNNGGGGAGAGGSIVFTILSGNFTGVTFEARGGAGGDADLGGNQHGPGGGGGGGVVLLGAGGGTVDVTAGLGGLTAANVAWGSTPGITPSSTTPNTTAPRTDVLPSEIPGLSAGAETSSFSIDDASGVEGDAGTTSIVFTVTLRCPQVSTLTVDYATSDASAADPDDYAAASGTLTFDPGVLTQTIPVTVNGDALSEGDHTFTVTLSNPSTGVRITRAAATGTILDDDVAPTLSIGDATVAEPNSGTANAVFTVTRSGAVGSTVTVSYASTDGSAVAGSDYTVVNGTLTFSAGETQKTVVVPVLADALDEFDETFTVTLSGASVGVTRGTGTGTIQDDDADSPPTISIGDATVTEPGTGTVDAVFTISLSAASGKPVTISYATANGTASAAEGDYVTSTATLVFAPGETQKTVAVPVGADLLDEFDETFSVNLSGEVNASILDGTGLGTILDDASDLSPSLSINSLSVTEGDAPDSTAIVFTVSLSAASGKPVSVDFATADGTASSASDYAALSGTLNFAAGQVQQTVSVTVNGDLLSEADETFTVTLSSEVNASISGGTGTGTILDDDELPSISISDASLPEGNAGSSGAVFTVTLSAASGQDVTVQFATANGTASVGTDYGSATGTVTFTPGQTTRTVTVTVLGDTTDEPSETFLVNLSSPFGATISDGQGEGTIVNDDIPADLSLTNTVDNATPGEGQTVEFTLVIAYTGPEDATNVIVVDLLPVGLTPVSSSATQGIYDTATGIWSVGTMPSGTSQTLAIRASVDSGTRGTTIACTATIGSTVQNDVNVANNQAGVSITVRIPDLTIEAEGALPGVPGADPFDHALPAGTAGARYEQRPYATGGLPGYVWSVLQADASGFPFNLDPFTGVISGNPPAGTYGFTLGVSDSQNPADSDVRRFTLTVNAPAGTPVVNAVPAPPEGMVGVGYSHVFTASGGQPPYTWVAVDPLLLPPGLGINLSTGELSGAPASAGDFTFQVRVTDDDSAAGTREFTVTIRPNPVAILTSDLPAGSAGSLYSQIIRAEGGVGPSFTWTVPAGTLPPGLSLSGTGRATTLSGTPVAEGTYVFALRISDGGQTGVTDDQTFIILISSLGTQPLITTSSIPAGMIGAPYEAQLTASGGTPPYTWSIAAGDLPQGLTLSAVSGLISGTPAQAGSFSIIAQVGDANDPSQSDTQELTLTVYPALAIVTASPLPYAVLNTAYSVPLEAVGGMAPYSWDVFSGSVPAGIQLSPFGLVSGVPTAAGTVLFTARVKDGNGAAVTRQFSLEVVNPASGPAVLTTQLPQGIVGVAYSATLSAAGGSLPYAWSIQAGTLPVGLSFNTSTGVISGVPRVTPGSTGLVFRVTDATTTWDDSVSMDLVVEAPLAILTDQLPVGQPGTLYSGTLLASGGTAPRSWGLLEGSLPPGLSLDAYSGAITGTPAFRGTWTFMVQVTDADGDTVEKVMTIVIWELSNNLQAGYCWASAGSGPSEGGLWPAALALAAIVLLLWGRTGTSKGVLS